MPSVSASTLRYTSMLRRHPSWGGYRGHWLNALARSRHQKPEAVIAQRHRPVGMADRPDKPLDKGGKARFTLLIAQTVHRSLGCSRGMPHANHILMAEVVNTTTSVMSWVSADSPGAISLASSW
jgi:hypothetical protein